MSLRSMSDDLTTEEITAISHNVVQLGVRDPATTVATVVGWATEQELLERMRERGALTGVAPSSLLRLASGARAPVVNLALAEWGNQVEPINQRGWEWDGPNGWSGLLSGFVEFANRTSRRHVKVWS